MHRPIRLVLVFGLLVAAPALASYGSKPDLPQPAQSGNDAPRSNDGLQTPRQRAEPWYRDAWNDVQRGSKDAASGNAKSAEKRFRRALDHSREAVEIDSTYAEAWNLVGFTSRKLGDYPGSFAAYGTAVRQKPDFALAHEYWGEGLLETGDLHGALEHLAALRRIGDQAMLDELQASVDRYVAAHPDSSAMGAAGR